MSLFNNLSGYWFRIQDSLFPWMEERIGELTNKQLQLVTVLEIIRLEAFIQNCVGFPGRPLEDRIAIARAFVAKMVYNLSTTRALLDRLECDIKLRRICGWEKKSQVPSESTFSRAFAEFAEGELPQKVHAALIKETYGDQLVGHISRDSTKIDAREKPVKKTEPVKEEPKRKQGRPKKGEEPKKKDPTRLEQQLSMTLEEMLNDIPTDCDVGAKKDSKGFKESWIGYKLHIDAADGQIPISCILTSASLHDSQAAIPLATMTDLRTTNCYDLMDSAYDAAPIKEHSRSLGHVPIIGINPRSNTKLKEEIKAEAKRRSLLNFSTPEDVRYRERNTVERVNGRLKDEFGGLMIRVRGNAKVMCHLMFGILALTVDQLTRFVT